MVFRPDSSLLITVAVACQRWTIAGLENDLALKSALLLSLGVIAVGPVALEGLGLEGVEFVNRLLSSRS